MSEPLGEILQPGVDIRPKITSEESQLLIEKLYGLKCSSISELNAYDDKNFKIKVQEINSNANISSVNKNGYVFKIMNSLDSKNESIIDAQTCMMLYLGEYKINCPKPVRNKNGRFYSSEILQNKQKHIVRLLEYLPGQIFCNVPPSRELFHDAGRYIANIDLILKNFHHKAYATHKTLWMFHSVPEVKKFLHVIADENDRKMIEAIINDFEIEVMTKLDSFEKGYIHGDFNEQNIVVKQENDQWKVEAILDFGDSQYSCLLFELAIALTYMIIQGKELEIGAHFIAGFSSVRPIPEQEYELLKICVAARFCQSLVLGAYSGLQNPENKYVLSTQAVGWSLLRKLWNTPKDELYSNWEKIADIHKIKK